MKSASYITPTHLLERLSKTGFFQKHHDIDPINPWKVGICVSGGSDSMALAYLIQNMPHPLNEGKKAFSARAFVIDHAARDGSYEEAMWVKDQLEQLNINTDIRRIKWPPSVEPASMQGFEMAARYERYRALGKLAHEHRLSALFAGHHEDDQVETIITRLLRDQTFNPFSFRGIETTTSLPCNAKYLYRTPNSSPPFPQSSRRDKEPTSTGLTGQLQHEKFFGGVQLHRPLLGCKKSDLVATCDHFMVPYVQDKTNFDPQHTIRNTIRHLRTNHNLPNALQRTSLLNLRTKAITIIDAIAKQAREFHNHYVLDLRMHGETGTIFLRLRSLPPSMDESQLRAFSYLIQRIVNLVSPMDPYNKHSMLDRQHTESLHALVTGSKSTGSVIIDKVVCHRESNVSVSKDILVTFSRQPFTQVEKDTLTIPFSDFGILALPETHSSERCHTQIRLWDSRFFISVSGEKNAVTSTVLRPYNLSDVPAVRVALRKRKLDQELRSVFSTIAPGHIRHTLPVLVVSGEIVAFPTLHLRVVPLPPIDWDVRYARDERSTEFFFPGIKRGAIITWKLGRSKKLQVRNVSTPRNNRVQRSVEKVADAQEC